MLLAEQETNSDENFIETSASNDTCLKHAKRLTTETIVEIVTVSPIILFIVVSNAFVLVLFARERRLHKKRYWFIASLALADFLIGLLIMPLTLTYKAMNYWPLGISLCEIWLATDVWLCTTSTLTICVIGLDRYMTLAKPLLYSHSAATWLASAWAIALLIALPPLLSWIPADRGCKCDLSTDTGYVLMSAFGTFYIPLAIIGFTYWKIYRIATQRMKITKSKLEQQSKVINEITIVNPNTIEHDLKRKQTAATLMPLKSSGSRKYSENSSAGTYKPPLHRSSSALNCSDLARESRNSGRSFNLSNLTPKHPLNAANCTENAELLDKLYKDRIQRIRKKERQSTLLVTMIILSFVICWGPFFVVYLLRAFSIIIDGIPFDIVFFFGYCNSAINPVLYGLFNVDFKASFKKVLLNR